MRLKEVHLNNIRNAFKHFIYTEKTAELKSQQNKLTEMTKDRRAKVVAGNK